MAPLVDPEENQLVRWYREEVLVHEGALRSYLRSAFPSVHEVDDIVQEALVRVFKARQAGTLQAPKGFLFTTVRNAAIDVLRRRKIVAIDSIAEIDALSVVEDKPSVPETVGTKLDLEILTEAIQSLPERCRQVLTLRKIYGLSQREIAQRLGISEHTVEVQVGNGVRRCAEFLRRRGLMDGGKGPR